jgi:hypothetical protein
MSNSGKPAGHLDAPAVTPQLEAPPRLPAARRHQRRYHHKGGQDGQAPQHHEERCKECMELQGLEASAACQSPMLWHAHDAYPQLC